MFWAHKSSFLTGTCPKKLLAVILFICIFFTLELCSNAVAIPIFPPTDLNCPPSLPKWPSPSRGKDIRELFFRPPPYNSFSNHFGGKKLFSTLSLVTFLPSQAKTRPNTINSKVKISQVLIAGQKDRDPHLFFLFCAKENYIPAVSPTYSSPF